MDIKISFLEIPKDYFDLLNRAIAREIQVSAQYMLQHTKMEKLLRKVIKENYLLDTTTYDEFGKILKEIAIEEMKHIADIAERIYYLGGEATTKPDKIIIGNSIKEFAQINLKAEEEALTLYRQIIQEARRVGDRTTWPLFSKIYKGRRRIFINISIIC